MQLFAVKGGRVYLMRTLHDRLGGDVKIRDDSEKVRALLIALEVALVVIAISIVLPFAPQLALAMAAMATLGLLLGYKVTRRHK